MIAMATRGGRIEDGFEFLAEAFGMSRQYNAKLLRES
jgi:hypothetical protein